MTGFIRIRNGIWKTVIKWNDDTGKLRSKEQTTKLPEKGNKRRAEAMLKQRMEALQAELDTAAETGKPVKTLYFLEELERWLEDVEVTKVKISHLREKKLIFKSYIQPYKPFQGLILNDLTPRILQGFVTDQVKKGLAPSTIHKRFYTISKFLKYMWRLEEIQINPAERVELPNLDRTQKNDVYTKEELRQLPNLFKGTPMYLVVLLATNFGLRKSEILGLKWDAIDFKNRYLYVQATTIEVGGKMLHTSDTKSKSSRRRLKLSEVVIRALQEEQALQERYKAKLGTGYQDDGFVCAWEDGRPVRPSYVTPRYKKVILQNGFRFVKLKDIRASVATVLHHSGMPLKNLQLFMGHSNVAVTGDVYTHADESTMIQMAHIMDQVHGANTPEHSLSSSLHKASENNAP